MNSKIVCVKTLNKENLITALKSCWSTDSNLFLLGVNMFVLFGTNSDSQKLAELSSKKTEAMIDFGICNVHSSTNMLVFSKLNIHRTNI